MPKLHSIDSSKNIMQIKYKRRKEIERRERKKCKAYSYKFAHLVIL
jgi:hypothetical protein